MHRCRQSYPGTGSLHGLPLGSTASAAVDGIPSRTLLQCDWVEVEPAAVFLWSCFVYQYWPQMLHGSST
ncbi:hypothetical protein OJAV_G00112070 [Oryzias javanicus]|uniref:Uncharacterized protein n=1 Tax=Oryzias javanicus TaxID=123683 RepID=A0A3S2UAX2_ORYJA|nr:hypothetical protein OJAV_G00112070 [Oryzias javanicus]